MLNPVFLEIFMNKKLLMAVLLASSASGLYAMQEDEKYAQSVAYNEVLDLPEPIPYPSQYGAPQGMQPYDAPYTAGPFCDEGGSEGGAKPKGGADKKRTFQDLVKQSGGNKVRLQCLLNQNDNKKYDAKAKVEGAPNELSSDRADQVIFELRNGTKKPEKKAEECCGSSPYACPSEPGAEAISGRLYWKTEVATALLRLVAVVIGQQSKYSENPSKLKLVLADFARIANEGVAYCNNVYAKGEADWFTHTSAMWLMNDIFALGRDLIGKNAIAKEDKEKIKEAAALLETEEDVQDGAKKLETEQKVSSFAKNFAKNVLPAVEGVAALVRSYDSYCASAENKIEKPSNCEEGSPCAKPASPETEKEPKYNPKFYVNDKRIKMFNLTYLCTVIISGSRLLMDYVDAKSVTAQ